MGFAQWGGYSPTGSSCGRRGRGLAAGLTGAEGARTPSRRPLGGGGAASLAEPRGPGGGGASTVGV